MIGSVINDRYRIESEVGTGGMANVYKAYDCLEQRFVAFKVIKKEYCVDPNYVRRFENEAKTVLNLRNKNIARAYDYGTYNGQSYIALEYIEGCTLKDSLKEHGAVSPRVAVKIACTILDALECAHNAGYIHQDVKPQNVLISSDKMVKLTDFGIAKDTEATTNTYDGESVIGSVHYLSPEQARGDFVGKESDLYSVGIMLYEMMTGELPFTGDNPFQIALKHINESIVPPMELDARIPPSISDVVIKATAKEPRDRYHSASDMKQDLIKALAHPNKRFVLPDDGMQIQPENTSERKKSKLWLVVASVSLIVAITVSMFAFGYFYLFNNASNDDVSKVPMLLGKTFEAAEEVAENREFELNLIGETASDEYPEGTVCWQSPSSGTTREKGSKIDVMLSSGSDKDAVVMIDLYGKTIEEASALLVKLGMTIEAITYSESDAELGTIIKQSIPAGNDAFRGDGVTVQISGTSGITEFQMPDLTKTADAEAAIALMKLYGITDYRIIYVGEDSVPPELTNISDNCVVSHNPGAGMPIIPSSTHVDLYLYSTAEKAAYADFSCSLVVDSDETPALVTVLTSLGEVVLYETVLDSGTQTMEFRAPYFNAGKYECIIYLNNIEAMRFTKVFIEE